MGVFAEPKKLVVAASAGVAFGYIAVLVLLFANHQWLVDASGHPFTTDFLAPKAAGDLARAGQAMAAYNDTLQHAAEVRIVGHDFAGRLSWPYPPHYFFLLIPLSYLSFVQAFVLATALTAGGYAATIGWIAQRREAVLMALAAPWCLAGMMVGQNGFLTAALIGMALLLLEKRPMVAALMICLLTYKPQFGLLIPFALIAGGYWRVTGWVAVMLLGLVLLTGAVFGFDGFAAFLSKLPSTTSSLVDQGAVGWGKLQSAYGLVRWLGASSLVAWTAQALVTAVSAVAVVGLWRSSRALALKAAGLSAALLLATPYVFLYDLPVLAVAIAFLARAQDFDRIEIAGIGLTVLAFVAAALLVAPLAWLGILAIVALCGRRWLQSGPCVRTA